jgi:hypothetical protein
MLVRDRSTDVDVHRALVNKPAGCADLLLPTVSGGGTRIEFAYRFLESAATLDRAGYKPARNTLRSIGADQKPYFKERLMHVTGAIGKFTKQTNTFGVLQLLFGEPPTLPKSGSAGGSV